MANGTCLHCSNPFEGRADKKYCSALCRAQFRYFADVDAARERARNIAQRDAEKRNAYFREYYQKNRDAKLKYVKKYSIDNPEVGLKSAKTYRAKNSQARSEYNRRYYDEHPGFARANAAKRRAMLHAAGTHTNQDILNLFRRANGQCLYCGTYAAFERGHVDHVVPLSRGGSNNVGNLAWSCAQCNLSKHNKFVTEWRLLTSKIV